MTSAAPPVRRAWTYLQERFPPLAHGPVVVAFAGGVACASAAMRGADGPGWPAVVVASVVALGVFFQLRVADEWKDAEEDRLYRPERPVPRGLVTLRELVSAAVAVAVVQIALAAWLDPRLPGVLAVVWAFGVLTTVEFGAREWLRQRPLATLVTHAPIVPLVDLFSVSCDVFGNDAGFPAGVGWLIGVSLFGGSVIEIGRKVWASADERPGVDTYSAAWGRKRALGAWAAAVIGSLVCGLGVLHYVPEAGGLGVVLVGAAALVVAVGVGALWTDRPGRGRGLETAAGVWTLGLYTLIGPVALWLS
jgi:4-hydroxybenzoate polyprenyltransferase